MTRILPAQRVRRGGGRGEGGGAGRAGNGRARAGAASTAAAPPAGGGCAASRRHEGAAGPQRLPLPLRPALVRPRPPHGSLRAPSRPARGSGVLPLPRFGVVCGELGGGRAGILVCGGARPLRGLWGCCWVIWGYIGPSRRLVGFGRQCSEVKELKGSAVSAQGGSWKPCCQTASYRRLLGFRKPYTEY